VIIILMSLDVCAHIWWWYGASAGGDNLLRSSVNCDLALPLSMVVVVRLSLLSPLL